MPTTFFIGRDTIEQTLEMKYQLIGISKAAGGFELSKWAYNSQKFCPDISRENKQFNFNPINTLKLVWNPNNDTFALKENMTDYQKGIPTKRTALSDSAILSKLLGWYR